MAIDTAQKIREDTLHWFHAQSLEIRVGGNTDDSIDPRPSGWKPPPVLWSKYNFGTSWSKRKKMSGDSWVLRDSKGIFIMHSIRSFGGVDSDVDAKNFGVFYGLSRVCKA